MNIRLFDENIQQFQLSKIPKIALFYNVLDCKTVELSSAAVLILNTVDYKLIF